MDSKLSLLVDLRLFLKNKHILFLGFFDYINSLFFVLMNMKFECNVKTIEIILL